METNRRTAAAFLVVVVLAMTTRVVLAAKVVPAEEPVVAGKLTVRVYAHALGTENGPLPVWTFVSDGLLARRQNELRITVMRGAQESAGDYPRDILALYRHP